MCPLGIVFLADDSLEMSTEFLFSLKNNNNKKKINIRMLSAAVLLSALTHYILNRLSHTLYWKSPISVLGTSGYEIYRFLEKNALTICKQRRS